MQAVKLCTNKILQFLTEGAGQCRLTCMIAAKRLLLLLLLFKGKRKDLGSGFDHS